jgi:hypothetical protein
VFQAPAYSYGAGPSHTVQRPGPAVATPPPANYGQSTFQVPAYNYGARPSHTAQRPGPAVATPPPPTFRIDPAKGAPDSPAQKKALDFAFEEVLRRDDDLALQAFAALPDVRAVGSHMTKLAVVGVPLHDRHVPIIGRLFPNLREFKAVATGTTDAGIVGLGTLRHLEVLRLTGNPYLEGRSLNQLSHLTNLHTLDLTHTGVSYLGIVNIGALPTLTTVVLKTLDRHADHFFAISDLRNVRDLDLSESGVEDETMDRLKGLTALTRLNLQSTFVSNTGIAHLTTLTRLKALNLRLTDVTEAGRDILRNLSSLTDLKIEPFQEYPAWP